jgi:hypothetical protein
MKVVINHCYGGFGLSDEAYEWLLAHGWKSTEDGNCRDEKTLYKKPKGDQYFGKYYKCGDDFNRADPDLVACVEALGEKANGRFSVLKVVEIPDDVQWEISDYDGMECVDEKHRSWY